MDTQHCIHLLIMKLHVYTWVHQDITIYIILLSVLMYSGEPSSRTRVPTCFTTCWMKFLQSMWPTLRWCLTFTIPNKGIFGTVFQLLGCLLAYLSAITISYQVYRPSYIIYSLKLALSMGPTYMIEKSLGP